MIQGINEYAHQLFLPPILPPGCIVGSGIFSRVGWMYIRTIFTDSQRLYCTDGDFFCSKTLAADLAQRCDNPYVPTPGSCFLYFSRQLGYREAAPLPQDSLVWPSRTTTRPPPRGPLLALRLVASSRWATSRLPTRLPAAARHLR